MRTAVDKKAGIFNLQFFKGKGREGKDLVQVSFLLKPAYVLKKLVKTLKIVPREPTRFGEFHALGAKAIESGDCLEILSRKDSLFYYGSKLGRIVVVGREGFHALVWGDRLCGVRNIDFLEAVCAL